MEAPACRYVPRSKCRVRVQIRRPNSHSCVELVFWRGRNLALGFFAAAAAAPAGVLRRPTLARESTLSQRLPKSALNLCTFVVVCSAAAGLLSQCANPSRAVGPPMMMMMMALLTTPCPALLCRSAIAIASFRLHPAQVSPRLPETWQGTAQCFKAKKNQLKETHTHTHTLTFAHEQTKRFAQFWLWFCN